MSREGQKVFAVIALDSLQLQWGWRELQTVERGRGKRGPVGRNGPQWQALDARRTLKRQKSRTAACSGLAQFTVIIGIILVSSEGN